MPMSHGDLAVFVERPISAVFILACALIVLIQILGYAARLRSPSINPRKAEQERQELVSE